MSFIGEMEPTPRGPRGSRIQVERAKPESRTAVSQASPLERVEQMRVLLEEMFPGREEQVEHAILGLMTGLPVFFASPPGTAKTALVDTIARLIEGARYFRYLLTQFTEPDELLGPIDIAALREGRLRRVTTGRLPEANIVFLDEVFKASSAIRNTLLDIILNRRVMIDNNYVSLDLKAIYTASNEVPEESEDWAFYDRLTIRSFFGYAPEDVLEDVIRKGALFTYAGTDIIKKPIMHITDVERLQAMVREKAVKLAQNKKVRGLLVKAVAAIRRAGIEYSDRRAVQAVAVVAAYSLLRGRVGAGEVADAIMATAPQTPEQVPAIEEELQKAGLFASKETIEKLNVLVEEAKNLQAEFEKTQSLQTLMQIARVVKEIQKLVQQAERLPKTLTKAIEEVVARYNATLEKLREEGLEF